MKNSNKILLFLAIASTLTLASQASAQYQGVSGDGIAASPKVREQMDQSKKTATLHSGQSAWSGFLQNAFTASPKLREQLEQRAVARSEPSTAVVSTGYNATGADGITASPKGRQQLDEQSSQQVMIAPLK